MIEKNLGALAFPLEDVVFFEAVVNQIIDVENELVCVLSIGKIGTEARM